MGEYLNAIGQSYFAQLDITNMLLQGQLNVTSTRLLSVGITGYNPKVKYMFNSPVELNQGSIYIDIDRDIKDAVSTENSDDNEKAYCLQSGIFSSMMEHEILQQFTGVETVSTIKALSMANERGIKTFAVTSDNIAEIMPQLNISETVKSDIQSAVNTGNIVIVPQDNVQINEWNGVGYIILDPDTCAAAYMISGGINGGGMTFEQALYEYFEYVINGLITMIIYECIQVLLYSFLPVV